jgi:hypothetical protein
MKPTVLLIALPLVAIAGVWWFVASASSMRIGKFREQVQALSASEARVRITHVATELTVPFDEDVRHAMPSEADRYAIRDLGHALELPPSLLITENSATIAAYYHGGYLSFPVVGHKTVAKITGTRLGDYLDRVESGPGK